MTSAFPVRTIAAAVLAALFAAGCGDGKGAAKPADPGKMVVAEDPAGGYRLKVPEGWTRVEFPRSNPRRRWFAGAWAPPTPGIAVEGIFTHLMAANVPAAEFGGRIAGASISTLENPGNYALVAGGPATAAGKPAYKIEARYASQLGEIFEASAYVEVGTGVGVVVTSRAAGADDAMARARLEAALAGFESIPREIRAGVPHAWPGKIKFTPPAGFDPAGGPAPRSVVGFCLGPIDGDRQELVSILLLPTGPNQKKVEGDLFAAASRGLTGGEPVELSFASGKARGVLYTPKPDGPRYETAIAGGLLGQGDAAIVVQAAMNPPGRALKLLQTVASSLEWVPEPYALESVARGKTGQQIVPLPRGWETREENGWIAAARFETLESDGPGGEPRRQTIQQAQVMFEEDVTGSENPLGRAQIIAKTADPKKASPLGAENLTLPDGRPAARLTVLLDGAVDVLAFARVSAGAIATVRVVGVSGCALQSQTLALDILAGVRYARLEEQVAPAEDVAKRSREALAGIVERARASAGGEEWYVFEQEGKNVGGVRVTLRPDGSWTDRQVRVAGKASITNTIEGAPGRTVETVRIEGPEKSECVTTIESTGDWVDVRRIPGGGAERTDRIARTDLFLPPDVAGSDRVFVGLAGAGEGTWSFQVVTAGVLVTRWQEFRVKGEEEIEIAGGKVSARRVEVGASTVVWVADGRVVRADGSGYVRRIEKPEVVKEFFKD
ncbi:MAG: hypothetical protein HYY18_23070 [Planctomycetes bacterium]|nr:hypothetical protein [Planctomycetota bacterium]